jgi:ABC-type antimicrobial peptide transport system permease subunit
MLAEAVIIGFMGSLLGIATSRLGLSLAKPFLQEQLGTTLTLAWWYSFDAPLLFGVVVLTALVALIPAMSAYRTDVAENLAPIT